MHFICISETFKNAFQGKSPKIFWKRAGVMSGEGLALDAYGASIPAPMALDTRPPCNILDPPLAMLCISAAYAVGRCLYQSVSPSRSCNLFCWKSKRINISSKNFLPSGSHTILVFLYQTLWQYSDGDPITRFSTNIWLWHRSLLDCRVSSTFRRWNIGYST